MNPTAPTPFFSAKLVVGLTILAVGLILLADSQRWYDAWHLLAWWPLALAALGVARLISDGPLSFRGHVWLGFATAGFISQFGPFGLLERWWPLFLVWGGSVIALRAIFPQPKRVKNAKTAPPVSSPSLSGDPEAGPKQVQS